MLASLLALFGCADRSAEPNALDPRQAATNATPICRSANELAQCDGKQATLEGVYRKRMSVKRQPRPGEEPERVFLGYVDIELQGDPPVRVELGAGPRPEDEVQAHADDSVRVTGLLKLDPTEGPADHAAQQPQPRLTEPGSVEPID